MAAAVGVLAGVAMGNLAPAAPAWSLPLAAVALLAGALGLHGRGRGWWFACGLLAGGAVCARAPRLPVAGGGTPVRFVATVRDGWSASLFGHANRLRILSLECGGKRLDGWGELRVEVAGKATVAELPAPGARVVGSGELWRGRGGALELPTLRLESALLLRAEGPGYGVDAWREGMVAALLRAAGSDVTRIDAAGIAAALALGRRELLRSGEVASLRASGLAHLLAVSGLHVGIVGGLLWGLLVLVRVPPVWRRWVLAGALVGFAVISGGFAPVRRAVGAAVAYLVARQLGRPLEPLPTVWGIVAGLVLLEPAALLAPGFQLSAGVTLALLRWVRPVAEALAFLPRRAAEAVAVAVVAQLAAAPLQGAHFGYLSLLAVPSNLAVAPVTVAMTAVAVAATALAPLGAGPAAGLLGLLAPLQGFLDGLAGAASVVVIPFPPPTAVGTAVFLALALWGLSRTRRAAAGAVTAVLAVTAWVVGLPPRERGAAEVRLLPVSDGMALIVRGGRSRILVDGGRSPGEAVRALAGARVRRLDGVVVTHPDADHIGGVAAVLERLAVRRLVLPARLAAVPEVIGLRQLARQRGVEEALVGAGQRLRVGEIVMDVLSPGASFRGSDNDASLVAALRVAGVRVLITGDIEAAGERTLVTARLPLRAAVLQLPHHGSRTSSTPAFLDAVAPVVALAATGERPRYRYPHPEVARRLWQRRVVLVDQSGGLRSLLLEGSVVTVGTNRPVRVRVAKGPR